MIDFTPTTDVVRNRYCEYPYVAQLEDDPADSTEFDRWLAAHDAEIRQLQRETDATIAERSRPEIGLHINVSEYRNGKHDALTIAAAAIRKQATSDMKGN